MNHSGIKLVTSVTKTSGISEHPIIGAVNPDGSAYVHFITKNASSYIRTIIKNNNWNELTDATRIVNGPYKISQLAFIRDPYDRWISGITQFLFNVFKNLNEIENNWEAIFKIITVQPNQDAHTITQSEFFCDYILDHFDFIYLTDFESTKNKIKNWITITKQQEFKNLDSSFPSNQTIEEKTKLQISNLLKVNLDNNNLFKQRIIDYYEVDYNLIEWIGKNNKWIK